MFITMLNLKMPILVCPLCLTFGLYSEKYEPSRYKCAAIRKLGLISNYTSRLNIFEYHQVRGSFVKFVDSLKKSSSRLSKIMQLGPFDIQVFIIIFPLSKLV